MKLVHASDCHSRTYELPEADLYVFTGDVLPDFIERGYDSARHDKAAQLNWIKQREGKWRKDFKIGDKPIITIRGNHDWHPYDNLFGGEVYSDLGGRVQTIKGLKVGFARGVSYDFPVGDFWSDTKEDNGDFKMEEIPEDVDLLITHAPSKGVLDLVPSKFKKGKPRNIGSDDISLWHVARFYGPHKDRPLIHLFGHCHEDGGKLFKTGETTFSNAACTFNVIDIP